jgi:hypothetical protein
MVDEQGQISDGALREKLAGLLMDAQSFALTHRPGDREGLARQDVAGPSSIMKLVQTEQEVAKYELLQQALGLRGLGWDAGDDFTADEIEVGRAWLALQELHDCRRQLGGAAQHHCQAGAGTALTVGCNAGYATLRGGG